MPVLPGILLLELLFFGTLATNSVNLLQSYDNFCHDVHEQLTKSVSELKS